MEGLGGLWAIFRPDLVGLRRQTGFVRDYLAFAGVGCSSFAGQRSWSSCLLFSSSLERRRTEERLAGRSWSSRCFWPAQPLLVGSEATPNCRMVFATAR
ncbi:hypothetical protein H5410_055450 [Solanum commersonii]|uniref:Uncharacterized protein n=1 Tax=Solanum commersonii TaxID=4109 RepID=A0A9J5WJD0_SOLCO|nr:hypothetical protein H5410_055450 [Solanum commersonii]